jgi:hypothetical protein
MKNKRRRQRRSRRRDQDAESKNKTKKKATAPQLLVSRLSLGSISTSRVRIASAHSREEVFKCTSQRLIEDSTGKKYFQAALSLAGPGLAPAGTPAFVFVGESIAAKAFIASIAMSDTSFENEILYVTLPDLTKQHWAQMQAKLGLTNVMRATLETSTTGPKTSPTYLFIDIYGCTVVDGDYFIP